jgi:hypothetical protein
VYENWVLKKILEPKREEVAGVWVKLHNEELRNLYASPDFSLMKSRMMSWVGHLTLTGGMRSAYNILIGKPEAMRPLGRPRCRWENDIKMDLMEIGWQGVD